MQRLLSTSKTWIKYYLNCKYLTFKIKIMFIYVKNYQIKSKTFCILPDLETYLLMILWAQNSSPKLRRIRSRKNSNLIRNKIKHSNLIWSRKILFCHRNLINKIVVMCLKIKILKCLVIKIFFLFYLSSLK